MHKKIQLHKSAIKAFYHYKEALSQNLYFKLILFLRSFQNPAVAVIFALSQKFFEKVVSYFKEKSPATVVWLFLLSILLHLQFIFLSAPKVLITPDTPLLYFLARLLQSLPGIALIFLYHAIVIVQATRLNYIVNNLRLFSHPNYTIALSYVLLCGLLPEWNNITPALIANSFTIWAISFFGQVYNAQSSGKSIFNIGAVTGIAVLLYPPLITLFVLMMLAVLVLRPFKLREVLIFIFSFLLPFYFLTAVLFLKDDLPLLKNQVMQIAWHTLSLKGRPLIVATSSTVVLLLLFWGLYFWQRNNHKLLIVARKSWSILIISILFFVPGAFLFKFAGWDAFLLCIVPCAAVSANGFYYSRNTILSALIFWIIVLVVLFNNVGSKFLH